MTPRISTQKPLNGLKAGEHGVVVQLGGGGQVNGRLTSLGMTPGVEVDMLQNFGRGPLMVLVRGTRVALGRGEARNILVQVNGL